MKKVCLNCAFFENVEVDYNGEILEQGYCTMQAIFKFVGEDDTCEDYTQGEKDDNN